MSRGVNISGYRFGRLLIVRLSRKGKRRYWLCECDCGNIKSVLHENLTSGQTKSCGCLARELSKQRCHERTGPAAAHYKHGFCVNKNQRLYRIWGGIKQRCGNPNVHNFCDYGGRGIKICSEWGEFEPFMKWALSHGYKNTLEIDRKDVNGDYSSDNCRWVTKKEQTMNKRSNHLITFNGETKTLFEWASHLNMNGSSLLWRIKKGWDVKKAFLTPIKLKKGVHDD